jgi:hypothetical protein
MSLADAEAMLRWTDSFRSIERKLLPALSRVVLVELAGRVPRRFAAVAVLNGAVVVATTSRDYS